MKLNIWLVHVSDQTERNEPILHTVLLIVRQIATSSTFFLLKYEFYYLSMQKSR